MALVPMSPIYHYEPNKFYAPDDLNSSSAFAAHDVALLCYFIEINRGSILNNFTKPIGIYLASKRCFYSISIGQEEEDGVVLWCSSAA
jgi:hypothetical protein